MTPSRVMVLNTTRANKHEVRYEGPFLIVRRNRGGAYTLRGKDGTEYQRPPSQLKLIQQDSIDIEPPHSYIEAQMQQILDHRTTTDGIEYLVKWKDLPASFNQWVPERNISGLSTIQSYWRKSGKVRPTTSVTPITPGTPSIPTHQPNKRVRFNLKFSH